MTCRVNFPNVDAIRKRRRQCPTCGRRTVFVEWFQEWYGWNATCLRCGEQWQGGERCPRPFAPGWRKHNIEAARRLWRDQTRRT